MSLIRDRNISPREYGKNGFHVHGKGLDRAAVGHLVKEGTGLGADLVRHVLLLAGVMGLVAIAAGALPDSTIYWHLLNWVSGLFV